MKYKLIEPRWPAIIVSMLAVVLHFALPPGMRTGPPWIGAAIVTVLVAIAYWCAITGRRMANQVIGIVIGGALTLAVIQGVFRLVVSVIEKRYPPLVVLQSAVILWVSNVIMFAVWYWRLDGGGPMRREHAEGRQTDAFLFPQMTMADGASQTWKPRFVDYLFLSFTASTAFSPTDVPILSRWAKLAMMVEAIISLATLIILVARAINTL